MLVLMPEALTWSPHWAVELLCAKLGGSDETFQSHSRAAVSPLSAIWTQTVLHYLPMSPGPRLDEQPGL